MDGISIKTDYGKLDARLLKLSEKLADPTPMLEQIGEAGEKAVKRNFREGGVPEKWKVSRRAAAQNGQTLIDNGVTGLVGSVTFDIQGRTVRIGSNVIYGRIHHFGGTITPKNGKFLRFKGADGWVTKKSVTIPARPWLVLHKQAFGRFNAIIKQHVEA